MQFIEGIDDGDARTRSLFNLEKRLVFDPLVYEQRYMKTVDILANKKFGKKIKRILEFGSAELKFFLYLKNGLQHATRIDLVDIDEDLMNRFHSRVDPLIMDHISQRGDKFKVNVWKGDVAISNPNFKDVDAVVAIELIEHVYPDVLEEVPYHIFGIVKPKLAVITTPNGEFNVLFDLKPFEYRHWDHKFEWTRTEFEDWCHNICVRFPNYCVQFHGVGKPPEGHEHLGSCSQLGFFIRKDFLESLNNSDDSEIVADSETDENVECEGYKLIHCQDYPFHRDDRTQNQKLLDECNYHLQRFRGMEEEYCNYEADRMEIPIEIVVKACWKFTETSTDEIRSLIKENFETDNDFVIFPPNERSDDERDYEQEEQEEEKLPAIETSQSEPESMWDTN